MGKILKSVEKAFEGMPVKRQKEIAKFIESNCKPYAEKSEVNPKKFESKVLQILENEQRWGMGVFAEVRVSLMQDEGVDPSKLNKDPLVDHVLEHVNAEEIESAIEENDKKSINELTKDQLLELLN